MDIKVLLLLPAALLVSMQLRIPFSQAATIGISASCCLPAMREPRRPAAPASVR